MKHILSTICLSLILATGFAQFEGVIEFEQQKHDTTTYAFFVKGDLVRIEEYDAKGNVTGVQLVNLHTEKVVALNTQRKIFINIKNTAPLPEVDLDIQKTNETKRIDGYMCSKVMVNDKSNGASAEYWMTKGDFAFFAELIRVLNRKDPISLYLFKTGLASGEFAVESTYTKPDGKRGVALKTKRIESKELKGSLFDIPKGYTELEN